MKLFHWNESETLRDYGWGDIIVMAETVEEARQMVKDAKPAGYREDEVYKDTLADPIVLEGKDAIITILGSA